MLLILIYLKVLMNTYIALDVLVVLVILDVLLVTLMPISTLH